MRMRKLDTTIMDVASLVENFDLLLGKLASVSSPEADLMIQEVADLGACSELLLSKLTNITPAAMGNGEFFAVCRLVRELTELQKLITGFTDIEQGHNAAQNNLQMAR